MKQYKNYFDSFIVFAFRISRRQVKRWEGKLIRDVLSRQLRREMYEKTKTGNSVFYPRIKPWYLAPEN